MLSCHLSSKSPDETQRHPPQGGAIQNSACRRAMPSSQGRTCSPRKSSLSGGATKCHAPKHGGIRHHSRTLHRFARIYGIASMIIPSPCIFSGTPHVSLQRKGFSTARERRPVTRHPRTLTPPPIETLGGGGGKRLVTIRYSHGRKPSLTLARVMSTRKPLAITGISGNSY